MIYFMFLVVHKGHAMWDQVLARAHSMARDDATESFALLEPGSYPLQDFFGRSAPSLFWLWDGCSLLFFRQAIGRAMNGTKTTEPVCHIHCLTILHHTPQDHVIVRVLHSKPQRLTRTLCLH